jgi:rod shape determining protein RodA
MGKYFRNIDWITIGLLIFLGLFGLFILITISQDVFIQQFLFIFTGIVVVYLISLFDRVYFDWFAVYGYICSIIFLISSYFGPNIRGATRWIIFGPVRIQPSEFVKPLLILFFAWLIKKYPPRIIKNLPIHFIFFVIPFLLVFKQPDLGSSIVYFSFWIMMMIAGGLSIRILIVSVIAMFIMMPFSWNHLSMYQKDRIYTFINPTIDPKGAGYNAVQATIAIGSGQLFGRGLGYGTQSHLKFLPEFHTDFIFATLIEELGFVGGVLLLLGYLILLWRLLMYMREVSDDIFVYSYSAGLFAMLLAQISINIGMNMGILPITGITLPFVSYGGSSIMSLSLAFGVFSAFNKGKRLLESVAIR